MSYNLEQGSGYTAQFGNAVYANSGGANTNISTTNATTYTIGGLQYNVASISAGAAPTTDIRTGLAPVALLGAQACVFVIGLNAAGNLRVVQGPVVAFPVGSAIGDVVLPLPPIPANFCPIAYQVIKNKNTAGTAAWTFGTSNFNVSNISSETAVQLHTLPNAAVANAAV
jgi:hypothetical protein